MQRDKTLLQQRLDLFEKIFPLQVRARFAVRESAALVRTCFMDRTPLDQPVSGLKNTGAVFPNLKGIFVLQVSRANLAIGYLKMTGQPVDIRGRKEQHGPFQTIAAISGTIITIYQRHLCHAPTSINCKMNKY
jgi:hypothetical protein